MRVRQLSLSHLCTIRFYVLSANLADFFCRKGAPSCLIMCLAPGSLSKECCQVKFQFRYVLAVLGFQALSSIVTITMPIQLLSTISLYMQFTPCKMELKCMSLTPEVIHVICERIDCHPITIQDMAAVLTTTGQDASLLINNLGAPYHNPIPVVYSNSLQDCNSWGVFLSYTKYLVYRV